MCLQVNRGLRELHLMKCDIRDFGVTRLAESLMFNLGLTYLNLSWLVLSLLYISQPDLVSPNLNFGFTYLKTDLDIPNYNLNFGFTYIKTDLDIPNYNLNFGFTYLWPDQTQHESYISQSELVIYILGVIHLNLSWSAISLVLHISP